MLSKSQPTSSHTPEQNGVAEREKNLEVTRANLVDIHVPNSYWLDAFLNVDTCLHKTISKEQQILECYDH